MVAAFAACGLLWTPIASAGDNPSPADPAISQYVESFPTTEGGRVVGSDARTQPIAPEIERQIERQGGDDAALLEAIVGSREQAQAKRAREAKTIDRTVQSGPISAGARAVGSGDDRLVFLLAALIALTGGAAGVEYARRRGQRPI